LSQKGLLKRFNIICYGHQPTIEEIRSEKAQKYRELKQDRNSKEFQEWFLSYRPGDINNAKAKTGEHNNDASKNIRTSSMKTVRQYKKNIKNKQTKQHKKQHKQKKRRTIKKRGFFF
jgi:hypothetical protein